MFAGHRLHADRKGHRQYRGQTLGNGSDGEPHHRREQLAQVLTLEKMAKRQNQACESQDEQREPAGK